MKGLKNFEFSAFLEECMRTKVVNKTKVESVQLEKTLELIVRVKLLVQFIFFLAFCHNF